MKPTSLLFSVLFSIGIATMFTGCSSTPSSPASTEPTTHALKVGDSFTYHYTSYDTTGKLVAGSDSTVTSKVILTNQTLYGMPNVAVLLANADSIYVEQTPNEGISRYETAKPISVGAAVPAVWVTVDTTTKNKTVVDTTMNTTISGAAASVHVSIIANFAGDTLVTAGTKTGVTAHKFVRLVTVVVSIPVYSVNSNTIVTVTSLYAPSIGYFSSIQDVDRSDSPMSPVPNYTNDQVLTMFSE